MPKTASSGSASASRTSPARKSRTPQGENDIFALDIGTRNVVGVIGHMDEHIFVVTEAVSVPHKRRDMLDGQIEDIGETARIVRQVKETLEARTGMTLSRVSIAAAGRALKTKRSSVEHDIDGKDKITDVMLRSLELEAVSKAQSELDKDDSERNTAFYCVGHTVIKYVLDDYPIKNLVGHKGKKAAVELIAAFLPSLVVESLYSVMDMNGLDVASLTLEPIAAMNVIIPPEVRLINIALVDIGAGTTDIAISQNGSIVAYAMATTAGDEITEEIIQKYLVDFETAEKMKLTPVGEEIVYTDILGFEQTIDSADFYEGLFPAVELLADTIATNIIEANGGAPSAVFLVGGGSLIPDLVGLVAEKLQIPENRVAIGGQNYQRNVDLSSVEISGPEFVTPIGIGITATLQTGYDFSLVTLNGNKIRIFDTKAVTAAELLMNAGFKTAQIIGRSGRGLTFTLNGEKQNLRGETSIPATISINGLPAALEHTIKNGDVVEFTPATIGQNAAVSISDIAGDIYSKKLTIDGEVYTFGRTARANGVVVTGSYSVQNYDSITIENIETLEDLIMSLPFDCDRLAFYKGERPVHHDYVLCENDAFITRNISSPRIGNTPVMTRAAMAARDEKANRTVNLFSNTPMTEKMRQSAAETAPSVMPAADTPTVAPYASASGLFASDFEMAAASEASAPSVPVSFAAEPEAVSEPAPVPAIPGGPFSVFLNGRRTVLEPRPGNAPHEFLELMAIADIDISNPPASGNMILTLNGQNASFMDILHEGDNIVIKWDE